MCARMASVSETAQIRMVCVRESWWVRESGDINKYESIYEIKQS
jgi:hypothetical protein